MLTAVQYSRLIRRALKEQNHSEAIKLSNDVLKIYPKNQLAIKTLKEMNTSFRVTEPDNALLGKVQNLYQSGEFEKTSKICSELLSEYEGSVILRNILGACHLSVGNIKDAIDIFQKAINVGPNSAQSFNNLGLAYIKSNEEQTAKECFEKAISLDENYEPAVINYLSILIFPEDSSKLLKLFNKAKNKYTYSANAFNEFGVALRKVGEKKLAKIAFEIALELDSTHMNTLFNVGNAYLAEDDFENAVAAYRKCINHNQVKLEVWNNLGKAYTGLAKLDSAFSAYDECLRLDPNNANALNSVGKLHYLSGNSEKALQYYEATIASDPNYAAAYNNLGAYYFEVADDLDKALSYLLTARKLDPSIADMYNNLGNINIQRGQITKALEQYEKCIELDKGHQAAVIHLVAFAVQLGPLYENGKYVKYLTPSFQNFGIKNNLVLNVYYAIYSFTEGNIKATQEYLSEAEKTLDQLQSLPSVQRKFCGVYFDYLNNLISYQTENDQIKQLLYHVGESHCLSFANQSVYLSGENYQIKSKIIFGMKAFHLSSGRPNRFESILHSHLLQIPKGSRVLVSLGEIDCRVDEGLLAAHKKGYGDISGLVKDTVSKKIKWFSAAKERFEQDYIFFTVPAPAYRTDCTPEENEELRSVVKLYNEALIDQCKIFNFRVFNSYVLTSNQLGFSNGLYRADSNHLDPSIISILFN